MQNDTEYNEPDLVKRAIDDPDLFQHLYHYYFKRVYSYTASRIGNDQDTEDLVSEIFLRVIKNLDQLRNQHETSFAAWLFAIARNTITDYYRLNERLKSTLTLDVVEPLPSKDFTPDYLTTLNDEAKQLHHMILNLSERKREIVILRYYGGLRNHEIAKVLGIGEKTVSAYLSRALQELREAYHKILDQQRKTENNE